MSELIITGSDERVSKFQKLTDPIRRSLKLEFQTVKDVKITGNPERETKEDKKVKTLKIK